MVEVISSYPFVLAFLAAALAEVDDLSVLQALAESDNRTSAARHYRARIQELEATEPDSEAGDG